MNKLLIVFIFFISSAHANNVSTKGDSAIWDLAWANTVCAGVSKVNQDAVPGEPSNYLKGYLQSMVGTL